MEVNGRLQKYIVGVGACYIDTIMTVDHYPAEDAKLRAYSVDRRRGGNSPNSLQVLEQLLAHCQPGQSLHEPLLICALPSKSSAATQSIVSSLRGVNLDHCIHRDVSEPASSYVIRSKANDSRTIVNYNDLSEMKVAEFAAIADALGHDVELYHFEGRIPRVTLACIRHIRSRFPSVLISVEVEKPEREGLQELAAEADFVFYSKTWAQSRGYASSEACLRDQKSFAPRAKLLCCTWGEEGAGVLSRAQNEFIHVRAFKHNGFKVIDTLGAGDTFIGAMLFAIVTQSKSWSLLQMLQFANEVAGRKVVQEGFEGLGEQMQLSQSSAEAALHSTKSRSSDDQTRIPLFLPPA